MLLRRKLVKNQNQLKDADKVFYIDPQSTYTTGKDLYKYGKINNGKIFIGYKNKKPVATVFVHIYRNIVMISNLEVKKQYQHRGLGSKIMNQIKKIFKDKIIILEIKKHTTLKKFYANFGIVPLDDSNTYSSAQFNLLTSDPNINSGAITSYFAFEDHSGKCYYHQQNKKLNIPV